MKQAVLYVCHGSRLPKAREEAVSFIEKCQKKIEADIQQICFLELATPLIKDGFQACVEQGASRIAVVPLLLFSAVHAKVDIPNEIQQMKELYPFIEVTYGKPIGVHEKMADTVIERVKESNELNTTSNVILIGRGSTDTEAIRDFQTLAEWVKRKTGVLHVSTCFLHGGKPHFEDALQQVSNDKQATFFVPYLLFTGLLMKDIERKINGAQKKNPQIHLCRYLGYAPQVEEVFVERVREAIELSKGE